MKKNLMNEIVKMASQMQNDKLKLNAGQWREAVAIIIFSMSYLRIQIKRKETIQMKKTSAKKATKKATPKKK